MAKIEFLVVIAFTALACCTEAEDSEQKKRGTAKGTTLNSIPTGGQKQDYTYNIYSQNPSTQTASNPSYQPQVSNSFYPNQANQYYSNPPSDSSGYVQHPQLSILPPTQSQFVPINFVPNPGYHSKYQIVPSQGKGNIHLAIVQQPNNYQTPSLYSSYPQNIFATNPTPIAPQQNFLNGFPSSGQFNVAPQLPLSLGNPYLGQPSTMVLLAQPNPSLYNNLLFNSPGQSLYNYFPSNSAPKYGLPYPQSVSSDLQIPLSQNIGKEENEISPHTSDYTTSADSYKNAYASSRSAYSKH